MGTAPAAGIGCPEDPVPDTPSPTPDPEHGHPVPDTLSRAPRPAWGSESHVPGSLGAFLTQDPPGNRGRIQAQTPLGAWAEQGLGWGWLRREADKPSNPGRGLAGVRPLSPLLPSSLLFPRQSRSAPCGEIRRQGPCTREQMGASVAGDPRTPQAVNRSAPTPPPIPVFPGRISSSSATAGNWGVGELSPYLGLGEPQLGGQLGPFGQRQVLGFLEAALQSCQLVAGVDGAGLADLLGFPIDHPHLRLRLLLHRHWGQRAEV